MKFGLYATPDCNILARCIDGKFDRIQLPNPRYGWDFQSILDAPGKACSQEIIKSKLRQQGSLLTPSRTIAKITYNIPDDVELYTYGDFGVHQ